MNPCSSADTLTRRPKSVVVDGVVVASVRARTAAATAGLVAGDRILSINGQALRDTIDFQFHAADDALDLEIERAGARLTLALERRGDLGVELEPPRPAEISTCANKCVFCFIHQLPRGMRKSLYVKDDDYRLSFLHGNYITLSDLDEAAMGRIVEQRLSPLYVSVHATDPEVRHMLLGRPRHSADILPRMTRLARAGIRMHAQIVLCPGLNDGAHLERTVFDLSRLHPAVATTAIVPVGLTRHRDRLPQLRTVTPGEARLLVDTVEDWQRRFLEATGSRLVFLADEIYLLAERPLPPADAYEGFLVAEDGIGLVRRFEDAVRRRLSRLASGTAARRRTIVTGEMFGPRMRALATSLPGGSSLQVVAVPNEHFGRGIGVVGLLTGRDIQRALASVDDLGDAVLVPAVTVRDRDGVFLDDLTPEDLAHELGVPVRIIEPEARAFLQAACSA